MKRVNYSFGSWVKAIEKCLRDDTYVKPELPIALTRENFTYQRYLINEEYLTSIGYDLKLLTQYISESKSDDLRAKAASKVEEYKSFIEKHCGDCLVYGNFIAVTMRDAYCKKYEGCVPAEQKRARELDF